MRSISDTRQKVYCFIIAVLSLPDDSKTGCITTIVPNREDGGNDCYPYFVYIGHPRTRLITNIQLCKGGQLFNSVGCLNLNSLTFTYFRFLFGFYSDCRLQFLVFLPEPVEDILSV